MARVVSEFPNRVRTIENLWIPLPSGERLAARAWLPDGAETKPVPAILEAIPYRRRDFTRGRDEPLHAYVAGHGYACIRLDSRGSGDSDGVIADEYSEDELADIEHVIAWLAAQPWCSGAIGMMGISWGGINSLQVAARRPTALKAIISLCSTDDRYGGDAHYMGGCLLNENFAWGSVFFIHGALPPDPQVVGERWRAMWLERLNAVPLYPALWMAHQRRDSFWIRGSVCVDYQRINCPVLAIGGWADAYTNTVPRLLSGLRGARKGIIGPWGHAFPHEGTPEPAIGFLQEALRWWDHWLKDIDNGVEKDPILTAWMPDAQSPSTTLRNGTGRWIYERNWPPETTDRRYHFTASGLELDAAPSPAITVRSPVWTGHAGGAWCAFGARGEMPGDQRSDDAGSAVFDTRPLPDPVEVLGAPTLIL
jgi:putative CocE/NonD family hydrolase